MDIVLYSNFAALKISEEMRQHTYGRSDNDCMAMIIGKVRVYDSVHRSWPSAASDVWSFTHKYANDLYLYNH